MSTYILELPYTSPPLSLNRSVNRWEKARWVKQLQHDVTMLALHGKVPSGWARARITLVWHPPDRKRRDTDNPTPTLKALIDGLVKFGLVPDDSSEFVTSAVEIAEIRRPGQLLLRIEANL